MKLRFIFNPHSGNNRRNPWLLEELRRHCSRKDIDADLCVTERAGHATELAAHAVSNGFTHVVAVGGDGTMNETAQALIGTKTILALVPCGSGNGLALHLGISTKPLEALRLLFDERSRVVAIDTGCVDGHPFFNVIGLGLDAEICQRFNLLHQRGLSSYVRTALSAAFGHRPLPVTITDASGKCLKAIATLVAVANSDQYGNKAFIAPGARVDDGQLDLVILKPFIPFGVLQEVYRLFAGTLDRSRRVERMRSSDFVIERAFPGPIHIDGESHKAGTRIVVTVRPRSLRIVVPAKGYIQSIAS